jgi:hypothetical protein
MNIFGNLDPRVRTSKSQAGEKAVSESNQPQAIGGFDNVPLKGPEARPVGFDEQPVRRAEQQPVVDEWSPQPVPRSWHASNVVFAVIIVMMLGMAGGLAYSYFTLRGVNVSISQIPGLLESVGGLHARISTIEAKLRDLTADQGQVADRVGSLDNKVNSGFEAANHQTQQMVGQAEGRLRAETDQKNGVLTARLSHVEQNQNDDRERLAQLNQQLQQQVETLQAEWANTREGTRRAFTSLNSQLGQNQAGLQDLGDKLHREKVTFEVPTKSRTELVPGIALTVLKTDTGRQRIRGYLSLTHEGRTLWLDNLGIQESLDLFPRDAVRPYSLVITHITSENVAGYLLLPSRV